MHTPNSNTAQPLTQIEIFTEIRYLLNIHGVSGFSYLSVTRKCAFVDLKPHSEISKII